MKLLSLLFLALAAASRPRLENLRRGDPDAVMSSLTLRNGESLPLTRRDYNWLLTAVDVSEQNGSCSFEYFRVCKKWLKVSEKKN